MNYQCINLPEGREQDSLKQIESYATDILKNLVDYAFTDHSIVHSYRILKVIDNILSQTQKQDFLNTKEKYTLQAAAFLHDIGMQEEKEEPKSTLRREKHQFLSSSRIQKDFDSFSMPQEMVELVCKTIEGHRGNLEIENEIIVGTCDTVRIDLLKALLYIGDELDITFERVDPKVKERIRYSIDNLTHFYKHYYTAGITIAPTREIKIRFRHPPGRERDIAMLLEPLVVCKIQYAFKKVAPILSSKYKIDVFFNARTGAEFSEEKTLELIERKTFEDILKNVILPKEVFAIKSLGFEQMKDSHLPDLFYSGTSRWEDIVNDLDIIRDQSVDAKNKIRSLLDFSCAQQCQTHLLITGEAGSGKTTFLMRLAYDLSNNKDFDGIDILWFSGPGKFDLLKIADYHFKTIKPLIIFIDVRNINVFIEDFKEVRQEFANKAVPIVLVIAARQSEWDNTKGESVFASKKRDQVVLQLLSDTEINFLLSKLGKFNKLDKLTPLSPEERFKKFKEYCGSQLLVAMLEATKDRKFEDIIFDEYSNLLKLCPDGARAYELVALFHKYLVPTPKSLLIKYFMCYDETDFITRILEHTRLIIIRDQFSIVQEMYITRHPEIAKVLIERLPNLGTEEEILKRVGVVISFIEPHIRIERYYAMQFIRNFTDVLKRNFSLEEQEDKMLFLKNMLKSRRDKLHFFIQRAGYEGHIPELVMFSSIFFSVRMIEENILCLREIVKLDKLNKISNYFLAKALLITKSETPEKIGDYFKNSYLGGNRTFKFLTEYMTFCIKNSLYEHIEPFIDGINDFVAYNREEDQLKKRLTAILRGYKNNKDRKKLTDEFCGLVDNLRITKELSPQDELFYIDTYEASDPRKAINILEKYLLTTNLTNKPKSVLIRLAYLTSKFDDLKPKATGYYEELYTKYIEHTRKPEDFVIVYEYLKFSLKNNIYTQQKSKYFELFRIAKKLNPQEIGVYLLFSEFLIQSNQRAELEFCEKTIEEGIKIAVESNRAQMPLAIKLKQLKLTVREKLSRLQG